MVCRARTGGKLRDQCPTLGLVMGIWNVSFDIGAPLLAVQTTPAQRLSSSLGRVERDAGVGNAVKCCVEEVSTYLVRT